MEKKFTNQLINETSPYLLQHAHNPVNWFPWSDAALQQAKKENKVILVSIGYSACHWCHVMERESFENEAVAAIMNDNFVNIKIDREERPDLDHIYMDAVQAMAGNGGWPLNVFLTPDAKPFYGGTYFPPVKAFNRSSWTEVLTGISTAWREQKNEIETQAENLVTHLQQSNTFIRSPLDIGGDADEQLVSTEECDDMFAAVMKNADKDWGGFGSAPKFPQTFTIRYLLQYHYFTGNKEALEQALLSIDKMLLGGIYDHIGGGLARYSTDKEWLAPHFEKMLYDNALLIMVLCDAYQLTSAIKYEKAIRKTIRFVMDELIHADGGFFAALDADSEGEEGKYYVWRKEEVERILGKDAPIFCAFFDVTETGNWEGKNILRILKPIEDFVIENNLDKDQFENIINGCLQKLGAVRELRVKPNLDDKILLGSNALMLKAISFAAIVLQDDVYREAAEKNFHFLQHGFSKNEQTFELFHTYKNGVAKYPAFLDDYAYLVSACIELYELTYDDKYLQSAKRYSEYLINNFSDEDGIFFYFTGEAQQDVIVRKKEVYDGATPSGNAVMAENLNALSIIYDLPSWGNRALAMASGLKPAVIKYPGSFGIWASILLQHLSGLNEIAVTGEGSFELAHKIQLEYIPNKIIMASNSKNDQFPLLVGKEFASAPLIYRCENYACSAPVSNIGSLLKEINSANKIRK
ncbi:MAG: thioredoxin domain-containing protein [Ferruginibacter sp.]